MFLLDTDVLSGLMSARPVPEVVRWMSERPAELLFTTTLCEAEILAGIAIMPEGRRRTELGTAARAIFLEEFAGRVLAFDAAAATVYADIIAARRQARLSTPPVDLMIAAIARSVDAAIVTRNTADFTDCGIPVINPWAG
jgi:hypothetical protein